MGKLTVLRTVVVLSALGAVVLPPTDSFAKNWLERIFSPPSSHAPRKRAPRAAKHQTTPVVAPIPEMRPDNEPPVTADENAEALAYAEPASNRSAAPFPSPVSPSADAKWVEPTEELEPPSREVAAPPRHDAVDQETAEATMPAPAPATIAQGTIDLRKSVPHASEIVAESDESIVVAAIIAPENPTRALDPAPVQGPPLPAPGEVALGGQIPGDALPTDPIPIPIPEPNPRFASLVKPDNVLPEDTLPDGVSPLQRAAIPMLPDPRTTMRPNSSGKLPAEEVACRARLAKLGVAFSDSEAQADEDVGCTVPYPIVVSSFGGGVDVSPNAEMNCAMAESAARFMQDVVTPAARAELGTTLSGISQASSYVCRPRHGTRKLSEHAFGNALDLAAFEMADKTSVEVEMTPPTDEEKRFLETIRKGACGPFKTVLGPGSDADHALHFHLDLEPRRRGGTFCQ